MSPFNCTACVLQQGGDKPLTLRQSKGEKGHCRAASWQFRGCSKATFHPLPLQCCLGPQSRDNTRWEIGLLQPEALCGDQQMRAEVIQVSSMPVTNKRLLAVLSGTTQPLEKCPGQQRCDQARSDKGLHKRSGPACPACTKTAQGTEQETEARLSMVQKRLTRRQSLPISDGCTMKFLFGSTKPGAVLSQKCSHSPITEYYLFLGQ